MNNLLEALRENTKHIHKALHKNPILKACQEEELKLNGYIQMLTAFYEPWKKILPSIELIPFNSLKPYLVERANLLQNDLKILKVEPSKLEPNKTQITDKGELLGMCYVVIGSSMGAIQLSQNIKASLGDQPVSYLSMSPKEAGWPMLSKYLREQQENDFQNACSAAINAFEQIQLKLS